jgi:transcriptional regulator of acetoin/glycerol metabolism
MHEKLCRFRVPDTNKAAAYGAWERFVQGECDVRGVRPEVAISWHRCRDQYRVVCPKRQIIQRWLDELHVDAAESRGAP